MTVDPEWNVRGTACDPSTELIASVKEKGVINPIHVRWEDVRTGKMKVIDGIRRYNAAVIAGVSKVPVINHGHISDTDAAIIAVLGNEEQKSFTKKQRNHAFSFLRQLGFKVPDIAKATGRKVQEVKDILQVSSTGDKRLKAAVNKDIKKGGIPSKVAGRAAKLPPKVQRKVVPKLKGKGVKQGTKVVQEAEKKAKVKKPGPKPHRKANPRKEPVEMWNAKPAVLAPDAPERVGQMEKILRDKLRHNPSHRIYNAQLLVLEVVKGKLQVMEVPGFEPG